MPLSKKGRTVPFSIILRHYYLLRRHKNDILLRWQIVRAYDSSLLGFGVRFGLFQGNNPCSRQQFDNQSRFPLGIDQIIPECRGI